MKLIPMPRMKDFLLEDFMIPMNINAKKLSEGTGISLDELNAIFNDELEITPSISKKLAVFLGVSDTLFYDIQNSIRKHNRELQYA